MRLLIFAILAIVSALPQTIPLAGGRRSVWADIRLLPPRAQTIRLALREPLLISTADSDFTPKVPDVPVVDQDGQPRRFFTDLIKNKVVVINFIFTRCTTICPPSGATFAKLQHSLSSEMGKDIFLVSVSIDPANDTPQRLREWGEKFGAGPGWTLVTGSPSEIKRLQQGFGVDTASPQDHSPVVIIGNEKKSQWKKIYGLGSAGLLIKVIQEVKM